MTRIIDWNKEKQDEYKKLKETHASALYLLSDFMNNRSLYSSLNTYYWGLNDKKETQFAKDLIDLYIGDAKFPEQKYYVQLIAGDEESYLSINPNGGAELGTKFGFGHWKTKFTRDEVVAIDPRFVPFMEEVED